MNETSLRAVFTLDEEAKKYIPAGHNLTPEKAEALATRLHEKGPRVATAFQTLRHKGRGYKNCEPCKTAAENLSGHPDTAEGEAAIDNNEEEPQAPAD